MTKVSINGAAIRDAESFHDVFAATLGFPNYYGRNLDAWIDCMTYLDDPGAGMTTIHVTPGELLVVCIDDAGSFKRQAPELWTAFLECAAFVNHRRLDVGEPAVLVVAAFVR